ncbi:MAG: hypothetical protein PHI52_04365 [Bacteroidales bacterium]|nr:hypothetical protein [Bacteroidales bacterium]
MKETTEEQKAEELLQKATNACTKETVKEPTYEEEINISQYFGNDHIQITLPEEVADKVSEIMEQEKIDFWEALAKVNKKDNSIE